MILNRSVAPPALPLRDIVFPRVNCLMLEDNIPLYSLFRKGQPIVALELIIPGGKYNEPKAEIAYYSAKMLMEGTSRYTSEEIADQIDFYGAHLEVSSTLDHISVKLYTLTKFFPSVLEILTHLLASSTFPKKEFERVKKIRIQQIEQQLAKNATYANLKFRESLFGKEHPYGAIASVDKAMAVGLKDVQTFYQEGFFRKPTIYLAGDAGSKEIDLVRACLKNLSFNNAPTVTVPSPTPGKKYAENRNNSTQASIRLGSLTLQRSDEQIHDLKITNELLGGFFGSRLMKSLREERGLTYGIHSSLIHRKHNSFFLVSTEVLKEKSEEAIAEIANQVHQLQSMPPASEELAMLKNYLKGKLLGSFNSPFAALEMLQSLHEGGLHENYWQDYLKRIDTITGDEVSQAARQFLQPHHWTEVVIG